MIGLRCALTVIFVLASVSVIHAADVVEDAYAAWSQGRPADAIPALRANAERTQRWDSWFDCGLAAAAAGERGPAVSWLLEAHRRAPLRSEPRSALAALHKPLPLRWLDRLGPIAWPGSGWSGVVLVLLAGSMLGYAIAARRRRLPLVIGLIALVAAAPGFIAHTLDERSPLIAVVSDSWLLDSAGTPKRPLAAGTILIKEPHPAWAGRLLVSDGDGNRGYVVEKDVVCPAAVAVKSQAQ